jgi:DNA polymerase III delta subunit
LVVGEPAIADARARELIAQVVPCESQDLDLDVFRAGEDSIDRVEASLRQVGMFSARRAVWLRGLSAGTEEKPQESASEDPLLALLQRGIPHGATLVVSAVRVDRRSRLYKWFQTHGRVEDLRVVLDKRGRMQDEDLEAFVRSAILEAGLASPSSAVLKLLRERAGTELGQLARELDKLCLACAQKGEITPRDVLTHVRDQAEAWVFDLTDAISARSLGRAAGLVGRLLEAGEPAIKLVALLARHLAELIEASRVLRALPAPALRNPGAFAKDYYPKLPPEVRNRFSSGFRAYYVFQGAAAFRRDELRRLHRSLVDADLALKSSRVAPEHLLLEFVQQACASGARSGGIS